MIRDDVVSALLRMNVSPNVLEDFPELPGEVEGLLVYGSQARGDAVPGSDLDVLALVAAPRPSTQSGDVNVRARVESSQLSSGVSRVGCRV